MVYDGSPPPYNGKKQMVDPASVYIMCHRPECKVSLCHVCLCGVDDLANVSQMKAFLIFHMLNIATGIGLVWEQFPDWSYRGLQWCKGPPDSSHCIICAEK